MAALMNAQLLDANTKSSLTATAMAEERTGNNVTAVGRGGGEASGSAQPLCPPTPMVAHLTNEEIEALNDVLSRMEMFEAEESSRIG